jgi:hypothetical protein
MKAIETTYNGIKFRSRLEARYAVLFDELGIKWEYESEGFDLGKGLYYLPDFYLPEVHLRHFEEGGVYFEVKPSCEKAEESGKKFDRFDGPLVVACGSPEFGWRSGDWLFEWHKGMWDNYMFIKHCKKCHIWEINFIEYGDCPKCHKLGEIDNWNQAVAIMKSCRF